MPDRRLLGIVEVDTGTLVIGDPAYLPDGTETRGNDASMAVDAAVSRFVVPIANGLALQIQNFGGDGSFAVYGDFDDDELMSIVIDLEPVELP
jgi:hypothetical protein